MFGYWFGVLVWVYLVVGLFVVCVRAVVVDDDLCCGLLLIAILFDLLVVWVFYWFVVGLDLV